jgi:hypothetical protein
MKFLFLPQFTKPQLILRLKIACYCYYALDRAYPFALTVGTVEQ